MLAVQVWGHNGAHVCKIASTFDPLTLFEKSGLIKEATDD
jgi:hypothetical protein